MCLLVAVDTQEVPGIIQVVDTGWEDTGWEDTGREDTGREDTGQEDTGREDTGQEDTGQVDTILEDTGQTAINMEVATDMDVSKSKLQS